MSASRDRASLLLARLAFWLAALVCTPGLSDLWVQALPDCEQTFLSGSRLAIPEKQECELGPGTHTYSAVEVRIQKTSFKWSKGIKGLQGEMRCLFGAQSFSFGNNQDPMILFLTNRGKGAKFRVRIGVRGWVKV